VLGQVAPSLKPAVHLTDLATVSAGNTPLWRCGAFPALTSKSAVTTSKTPCSLGRETRTVAVCIKRNDVCKA
jgi:hypothetical protein